MSLSYDRIKKRAEDGGFWTSYSDLATVLSILFLMMYVVATLRSTAVAVSERSLTKDAQKEIESLKEQLRSYEVLKEDYAETATKAEKKMYDDLLSQMELLEGDAKVEKEQLVEQAQETARKEENLNRYQKIIKNIIQTNMIVQKEIKTRDEVIRQKSQDIENLESSIREKEASIQRNREKIAGIQDSLKESVKKLATAKQASAKSRREMKTRIAQLQIEGARRVEALRKENLVAENQLSQTRTVMLARTQELEQTQTQLQQMESEKKRVLSELEKERQTYQLSLQQVKSQHETKMSEERVRFEESIRKEKLTAQEQVNRELAHKQKLETEKARYAEQLGQIEKTLSSAKSAAQQKEKALSQAMAERQKMHQQELTQVEGKYKSQIEKQADTFQGAMSELTAQHEKSLASAQEKFERGLASEKLSGEARVAAEKAHLAQVEAEKADYNAKLKGLAQRLEGTQAEIAKQEKEYRGQLAGQRAKSEQQEKEYRSQLEGQRGKFEKQIGDLKGEFEGNLARQKAAFEAGLAKERLSGAEREARQKAYGEKMAREKNDYNNKMRGLSDQLDSTRKAIASQQGDFQKSIANLSTENKGMARELTALREREEQRQLLAKKIQENFQKAGIKASINAKTGEVLIQFGEEYFDTGKASLKVGMRKVLQNAMPQYAKSILEDPKLAEKIASVEIVGFASPTFKGSYVDPKDLSPAARKAVDYNMDLSYQRAKSIFDFAFDPKRFSYKYQRELLPMAKVTGQGYLRAEGTKDNKEMSGEEYCIKYDCTKAQKVIIKFHFKD